MTTLVDALGHPIRAGDTVLTSRYSSPTFDITTKVVKVNKKTITVEIEKYIYDNSIKRTIRVIGPVKRFPYQMVVVDKQLEHNQKEFPEHML